MKSENKNKLYFIYFDYESEYTTFEFFDDTIELKRYKEANPIFEDLTQEEIEELNHLDIIEVV